MNMYICNFCNKAVSKFLPYDGATFDATYLMTKLGGVGSDVNNFLCPHCGSTDRERHLKLFLEKSRILENKKSIRILHFAPEKKLLNFLKTYNPEIHILADLYTNDLKFEKLNIEAIPYDDNSFDLVIANHVLEHVNKPEEALTQVNRVLKHDGIAILQTPFSSILHDTFEDSGITTDELRTILYGQNDHVRLFGKNIFNIYSKYLERLDVSYVDIQYTDYKNIHGINVKEPIFTFTKKHLEDQHENNQITFEIKDEQNSPVVSVLCLAYNHANFIRKTLDAFVMQKTKFPFEVLVGDDCSTDGTGDIIKEYMARYPKVIKGIFNSQNMGAASNFFNIYSLVKGRYIAICDGDDYWTDPLKLQKQVDYLEKNSECSLVYGNVNAHVNGQIFYDYVGGSKRDLSQLELQKMAGVNTLTAMFRNVLCDLPAELYTAIIGDLFLWSLLGKHGSGVYLNAILPSIYNIHEQGFYSTKSKSEINYNLTSTCYSLFLYYARVENMELADHYLAKTFQCCLLIEKQNEPGECTLENLVKDLKRLADGKYEIELKYLYQIIDAIRN